MLTDPSKDEYKTLSSEDPSFPVSLRDIPDVPERLFVRGALPSPSAPAIAIVGTRKASAQGIALARTFTRCFAKNGIAVVSGLALGIDAAAHSGALEENGYTLAVLGNGIDRIYPAEHTTLAHTIIAKGGGIVSEYAPGAISHKYQFLERNRIISAFSDAVVVIEAPTRSGSLATARFAAEQGKDVFVVPGSVTHPNYKGSHALIRDGAILATSAEEIMADLSIEVRGSRQDVSEARIEGPAVAIRDTLRAAGGSISLDIIITRTGLPAHIVSQALTLLLLENIVQEGPNGYSI